MTTILIAQFRRGGEWHAVTKPYWWSVASLRGWLIPMCHYPTARPRASELVSAPQKVKVVAPGSEPVGWTAEAAQVEMLYQPQITCNWCRRKLGLPVLEKARRKRVETGPVPVPEQPSLAELVATPGVTAADLERQLDGLAFIRMTATIEDGSEHTR